MAISGVNPKCYILALFVRDDGKRFLLGDDPYEFKDKQLHFQQNTIANDVVEVQGNDGYLLAGQVRRPGSQTFDGYVCNGTNSKEEVETKRRAFLQFFRRSHFYKVIYVFPNGTAIQRKQGFLVDDPTVQELYQQYPEYHVALNFEDVNYYTYEEDDQGQEIYAKEAIIKLTGGGATGGLIWDSYGVVWEDPWSLPLSISGVQFQILNNAGVRAPIENVELKGDTYQQTYSGKNLCGIPNQTFTHAGVSVTIQDGEITLNGTANTSATYNIQPISTTTLNGTYTTSLVYVSGDISNTSQSNLNVRYSDTTSIVSGSQATIRNENSYRTWSVENANVIFGLYLSNGTVYNNVKFKYQITAGSSPDYSYEPYTGGIPAPNPDYPQEIHTVTGEQTVTVTGKNLYNPNTVVVNKRLGSDGALINDSAYSTSDFIKVSPSVQYAYTRYTSGGGSSAVCFYDSERNFISRTVWSGSGNAGRTYFEFTTPQESEFVRICDFKTLTSLQFEKGVTSAYEPYQSQSYTIDLGSIELCKINDYQDYIYKGADGWYLHKACGKAVLDGSENWRSNPNYISSFNIPRPSTIKTGEKNMLSNRFSKFDTSLTNITDYGIVIGGSLNIKNIDITNADVAAFKSWLSSNNVLLYYPLITPTDTKITDATLIGQLDALGAMRLFIGENNLLVSATGSNLPATLEFSYPTKFATIGAEWEEGGTKGATIVDVDAIDNTYPVWELMGPATNPTISVLTTNTTLTYNGTITASQKLVIDMFNKTATLNGTSVIGNISGDFVYMAPGTNRVAYSADNTDAPDSTIYWQEVVG